MRILKAILCGVSVGSLGLATGPVSAHHSFSMFDYQHPTRWEGVVEKFMWVSPHVQIIFTATDPQHHGHWQVEGAAPNIMSRQGWNHSSFMPGDKITIVGFPMKDGSQAGSLYYALDAHGNKLYHDVQRRPGVS